MKKTAALLSIVLIFALSPRAFPAPAPSTSSANSDSVTGSSWQCQWSEGRKINFAMVFNEDGQYFVTRADGRDPFPGMWNMTGSDITWSDGAGRLYDLQVRGNSMIGKTSTLDMRQSRGRVYDGTIACTRKIDVRLISLGSK